MEEQFDYLEYLKNNKLFKEEEEEPKKEILNEGISDDFKSKLKEQIQDALEEKKDDKKPKKDKEEKPKPKEDDGEIDLEDESNLDLDLDIDSELGGDEDIEFRGDLGGNGEAEGLTDDEKQIQDNLKIAYDNAMQIGDKKLAKQIGNTITMFTRTHVVGGGEMEMTEEGDISEVTDPGAKWNSMEAEDRFNLVLEFVKDVDEAWEVADMEWDVVPDDVQANLDRDSLEEKNA